MSDNLISIILLIQWIGHVSFQDQFRIWLNLSRRLAVSLGLTIRLIEVLTVFNMVIRIGLVHYQKALVYRLICHLLVIRQLQLSHFLLIQLFHDLHLHPVLKYHHSKQIHLQLLKAFKLWI